MAKGSTSFAGRTVLVYGVAKGIGRVFAREFARRGARVAIADIDVRRVGETPSLIVGAAGEALAIARDDSVRKTAISAEVATGAADIVTNNIATCCMAGSRTSRSRDGSACGNMNLTPIARSNAYFVLRMKGAGQRAYSQHSLVRRLYPFATTRMPYVASRAA